jgi:hypothetical protein
VTPSTHTTSDTRIRANRRFQRWIIIKHRHLGTHILLFRFSIQQKTACLETKQDKYGQSYSFAVSFTGAFEKLERLNKYRSHSERGFLSFGEALARAQL